MLLILSIQSTRMIIVFLLVLSLITGCNNFNNMAVIPVYEKKHSINKTITIKPFNEMRSSIKNENDQYLGLLPLVPYTVLKYDYPGMIYEKDEFLDILLPETIAYNMRKSKLFKKTNFSLFGDQDAADYILEGDILSTLYEKHVLCYGVTVFGCIPLWMVGVPTNYNKYHLIVKVRLIDNNTNKVVYSGVYDETDGYLQGIAYGDERSTYGIIKRLYKMLNHNLSCRIIGDINNAMKQQDFYK